MNKITYDYDCKYHEPEICDCRGWRQKYVDGVKYINDIEVGEDKARIYAAIHAGTTGFCVVIAAYGEGYKSAQAKIKELEGSVTTIPYDEMKESMLRLYKQQVPRLNDVIDKHKSHIEKLEQANKIMREALVRIEPEHYNTTRVVLRHIAREAINQVKEMLGE